MDVFEVDLNPWVVVSFTDTYTVLVIYHSFELGHTLD
jgi:hypothetical protein